MTPSTPTAFIDAIALWSPALPGWPAARAAFRGDVAPAVTPVQRPAAELLPAAERRRAPETVALALEVAQHAVAQAGIDPAALLSVFTSAHGDLGITDYVCRTLVNTPLLVSPTKFHNSVHNAASGHWTMSVGCMQASTALSAHLHSFAAGLLEALTQCAAEARPVLLVGYDMAACGALASTTASRGVLAVALVLSPRRSRRSVAALEWALRAGASAGTNGGANAGVNMGLNTGLNTGTNTAPNAAPGPVLRSPAAQALRANAMADALPLFEALATEQAACIALPLSALLCLQLGLTALQGERSYCAHE